MVLDGDRAATKGAAAVRSGGRLVQVDKHDVYTEIAGASDVDERVHVRAIHIKHRTFSVEEFGCLGDIFFEDTQGAGVGDLQSGYVFAVLFENGLESRRVH